MHVTGEPDGPPTSVGQPICDLGTGMWGVQGILAALYERERTGRGQKVDCSLLETALGLLGVDRRGVAGRRAGADAPGRAAPPERAVPALRHPGRLHDDRRRDPGSLGALRPGARAGGLDRRPALPAERRPPPAPRGSGEGDRGGARDTAHGPLGRRPRRGRRARAAPSTPTRSCSPIPRCATSRMVVHADDPELGRVPHVRTPVRLSAEPGGGADRRARGSARTRPRSWEGSATRRPSWRRFGASA